MLSFMHPLFLMGTIFGRLCALVCLQDVKRLGKKERQKRPVTEQALKFKADDSLQTFSQWPQIFLFLESIIWEFLSVSSKYIYLNQTWGHPPPPWLSSDCLKGLSATYFLQPLRSLLTSPLPAALASNPSLCLAKAPLKNLCLGASVSL